MHLLFALWLACSSSTTEPPAEPTAASVELPGDFSTLTIPTEGAELTKHEGKELVLTYPGGEVRPLVESYVSALDGAGWVVEQPQSGGRFVRVQAHKEDQTLEFFVVAQPERAEVHMEFVGG